MSRPGGQARAAAAALSMTPVTAGTGPHDGEAAVFVDAWRARWPEWSVAMAFVAPAQRGRVAAWGALQQALSDAAWTGDDPTPGLAKLAWWQEELTGWTKGARRHPLGALLQPQAVPWLALSRALPRLQATRLRPGEAVVDERAWRDYAAALAACDAALFGAGSGQGTAAGGEVAAATSPAVAVIVRTLRGERSLLGAGAGATATSDTPSRGGPAVVAQAGAAPVVSDLAQPRAIHAALVDARLGSARAPLPAWRVPWLAWRAARNAR